MVDAAALDDPRQVVDTLHGAWANRRPVVVELGVSTDELRARQRCDDPPYTLTPAFELELERLQFLVWANAYDARNGEVIWWHGRKTARRFADQGVRQDDDADLALADGTLVFIDGGPAHPPRPRGRGSRSSTAGTPKPGGSFARIAPVRGTGARRAESTRWPRTSWPRWSTAPGRPGHRPGGIGKTRVLTERLGHLRADRGVHPSRDRPRLQHQGGRRAPEPCGDIMTPEGRHPDPQQHRICPSATARMAAGAGPGRSRSAGLVGAPVFEIRRRANTDAVVPYLEALSAIRLGLFPPEEAEEAYPDAAGVADGFDRYRGTRWPPMPSTSTSRSIGPSRSC